MKNKILFLIIVIALALIASMTAWFVINTKKETHIVKVNMPAGWDYNKSDEVICAKTNHLIVTLDEGQADATICLIPIEVETETAYDENFTLTAGVPVKIDVEKGAWFEIGVIESNPINENREIIFSVKNAEIHVADRDMVEVTPEVNNTNIAETDIDDSKSAEMEIPALIRVNGYLYYDSAEISTEGRCGMMDGMIDSVCEGDFSAEDNQSNFGEGYYYQYWPDANIFL